MKAETYLVKLQSDDDNVTMVVCAYSELQAKELAIKKWDDPDYSLVGCYKMIVGEVFALA